MRMTSSFLIAVIMIAATSLAAPGPLAPEEAPAHMTLPPGFKATLFAGEPDVKQPIAFAIDDRGRLWVAEAYTYPIRVGAAPKDNHAEGADLTQPTPEQLKDIFGGHDRILVFEDTNGDG